MFAGAGPGVLLTIWIEASIGERIMTSHASARPHPLETGKVPAAIAMFGSISASGDALLMDRSFLLGYVLCLVAILATFWLYFDDLRTLRRTRLTTGPWIGLFIIVLEFGVPASIGLTKAFGAPATDPTSSAPLIHNSPQGTIEDLKGNCNVTGGAGSLIYNEGTMKNIELNKNSTTGTPVPAGICIPASGSSGMNKP